MRNRCFASTLVRLAAGFAVVAGLSGCLFTSPEADGDDGTPDAGEAGPDVQTDVAPACQVPSEDCDLAHATATCTEDGSCAIDSCTDGYVNDDGDVENGCECATQQVWPDCDGDSYAAANVEPVTICEENSGPEDPGDVCGASSPDQWVGRDPSVEGQADCNDDNADAYPGYGSQQTMFDEGWMCDGVNNDCDDNTDESCCSPSESNSGWNYEAQRFEISAGEATDGDSFVDAEQIQILRPTQEAPEETVATAAWVSGESATFHVAHLAKDGRKVKHLHRTFGSSEESGLIELDAEIQGYQIQRVASGYAGLMVARGHLFAFRVRPALDEIEFSGSEFSEEESVETGTFSGLSGTSRGNSATIAYSVGQITEGNIVHRVEICNFSGDDLSSIACREVPGGEPGTRLENATHPEVAQTATGYLVGWWQNATSSGDGAEDQAVIRLVRLNSDLALAGSESRNTGELQVAAKPGETLPLDTPNDIIEVVTTPGSGDAEGGGDVAQAPYRVLYPNYAGELAGQLMMRSVSPGDLSAVGDGPTALSDPGGANWAPEAKPRADGRGVVAVWRRAESTSTQTSALVTGGFGFTDTTTKAGKPIDTGVPTGGKYKLSLEKLAAGFGTGWLFADERDNELRPYIRFLGAEGRPVCAAAPVQPNG